MEKSIFPVTKSQYAYAGGELGATFTYIRITVAHGLAKVRVHTTCVGVFNLGLGTHLWRRDVLYTHVHKACGGRRESHDYILSGGEMSMGYGSSRDT